LPGQPTPAMFPPADGEYATTDEFKQHVHRLLSRWFATLLASGDSAPTMHRTAGL
jgi:hypothetical protein